MVDALATVWACCVLAIIIMALRLILGRYSRAKWDWGDSLTAVAIVLAMARIAFAHLIIEWGTNNLDEAVREKIHWTDREIYRREVGGKATLVARCLYICLLWIQKLVLLVFYNHLVRDMPWGKMTMRVFGAVFAVTWMASIISTFVECRPFHLYWQAIPDPGNCNQAIVQLFVVGMTNIFTDLMLIALPMPVILQVRLSLIKKLQLAFLFSIGFMIVIITAIRIPFTVQSRDFETIRITWTSGEFLAATFVANAPKLYSFKHLIQRRNGAAQRASLTADPHVRGSRPTDDLEETAFSITHVVPLSDLKTEVANSSGSREEMWGSRRGSGKQEADHHHKEDDTQGAPGRKGMNE